MPVTKALYAKENMSYLSVFNLKLIGELSDEKEGSDFFDDISEELKDAISSVLKKHELKVLSTELMSHPIKSYNFLTCELCSSWFINRDQESDREDLENEIKDGAVFESKCLCCDCLPKAHKWHWSNI